MTDRFGRAGVDVTASARQGFVVVPDDDNDLPETTREVLILADGDLSFIFAGYEDDPATETISIEVKQGERYPYAIRRILESTSAEVLAVY